MMYCLLCVECMESEEQHNEAEERFPPTKQFHSTTKIGVVLEKMAGVEKNSQGTRQAWHFVSLSVSVRLSTCICLYVCVHVFTYASGH